MNNLFLLITFLACVGSVQAGVISVADVTPASLVAGASGAAVATFTTANPVPANGKFVVIFPTGFGVSGATVTAITGQTGAAGTGHTISCAAQTCTVTRGTSDSPAEFTPGVTTVSFGVVKNPTVSGDTGTFTITTQDNGGTAIDTLTSVPLVAITAGVIGTASVVPANDAAGATGTAVVTFTTANPVPADGTIVITFPANYDLTGTPVAAKTGGGFDGTLTVSVAAQVLTITRAGGAVAAAAAQTLTLTNIKNPATSGATGTFTITTTTAAPANIDTLATVAARTINIAITGGATQTIEKGAAVAVTGMTSGNFLCWKAGTSPSAVTACAGAGTATDVGTTGCGAVNNAAPVWTTLTNDDVSIIECTGTNTVVGTAVATILTEQIVVASQNITAGSIVTVAGLTTGNHLCWTAGTAAGGATCAAAGTTADLGVTGCGAADDNTIAWTTTSNDYIAIRECTGTNTNVGAEVDLVLGVTTTAAPTPTTTVSGASSEAAWSTMLTVFAIAMAAFSTL